MIAVHYSYASQFIRHPLPPSLSLPKESKTVQRVARAPRRNLKGVIAPGPDASPAADAPGNSRQHPLPDQAG